MIDLAVERTGQNGAGGLIVFIVLMLILALVAWKLKR